MMGNMALGLYGMIDPRKGVYQGNRERRLQMSNITEKCGEGERSNGNRGMGNDLNAAGKIRG